MRILALIALAVFTSRSLRSQTFAPIRGHVIGESLTDFLASTGRGPAYLSACRQATSKKLARHFKVDFATCQMFIAGIDLGMRFRLDIGQSLIPEDPSFKTSDHAEFSGGKLVALNIFIGEDRKILKKFSPLEMPPPSISYEHVLADMISRFGQPTATDAVRTQNGFGAQFEYPIAWWDLPQIFVRIGALDISMDTPITEVMLETQDERRLEIKEEMVNRRDTLQ
jgi:hypothetical protein